MTATTTMPIIGHSMPLVAWEPGQHLRCGSTIYVVELIHSDIYRLWEYRADKPRKQRAVGSLAYVRHCLDYFMYGNQ